MKDNSFLLQILFYIEVFIILLFGVSYCSLKIDRDLLKNSGYEIIEYINGSYKVYDKDSKVIYIYSRDSHVFTPVYNADGTIQVYKD